MEPQSRTIQAFHTVCTIRIYDDMDAAAASNILSAVEKECERFEHLFSHTLNDSALTQLNNAAGSACEVDPELATLIADSLQYSKATGGLFDISIGPVVAAWNSPETKTGLLAGDIQAPLQLETLLGHVDYTRIHVDGTTVSVQDPSSRLVLGGIAKGSIADALCTFMQQQGVHHGFVNLGGNVKVFGGKPTPAGGTEPFIVGLRVPKPSQADAEDIFAAVEITDGAVVTSGIYERGVASADGTFYHHIIDPRTGMPAETDLVSASLISETALDGDGYTTALIIMGAQQARAFVEALPNCEAVFVTNEGSIVTTSGIGSRVPFLLP